MPTVPFFGLISTPRDPSESLHWGKWTRGVCISLRRALHSNQSTDQQTIPPQTTTTMPSTTKRAIDHLPAPPPSSSSSQPHRSLQVLVLAAPRSGSTSLGTALQTLGYKTCVGVAHSYFVENHFPYWTEGIGIGYLGWEGAAYRVGEFERFLGGYEAVTGWGAALLAEELVEAYPEAKVVCTVRDADGWVESYRSTIMCTYLSWRKWLWLLPLCGGLEREFVRFKDTAIHAWSYGKPFDREQQKKYYLDHNERIKKLVPQDRLLMFDPKDGWEPLCKFLNQDIPTTSYPHAGVRTGFHEAMWVIWRRAVMRAARNVGAAGVVTALLVMTVRKYWLGGKLPVVPYSLAGRR
ncbi:hypothetical protein M409DRAFT_58781 [Zasmidium cellare ATCC 36951]|uniref:P-loop containing nucleoside triphosphate hydrolase protein n=1 Tax=Zasmidium cellare ATCC 36951 TaxID=1080233 RepID=A0A6A6C3U5_ZASCE|nr:uncharacterized protein M409DRAFT_58781 [Zasmidium cellare ATCC 36951]KAF2161695.1 hypothetical protein M409DRAFT_58781 [Zasmidium cellare ATCC 36951]